jgi:hypothetical protein
MRPVLVASLILLALQAVLYTFRNTSQQSTLRVEVVNSTNHHSIKDARVFVLSEEGKELTCAKTNDRGIAVLEAPEESQHPKYVW